MRFEQWLALAGVCGCLSACSGQTILANASAGGSAGSSADTGGGGPSPSGSAGTRPGQGGSSGLPTDTQEKSDKLDVLFVVDNSLSMGGKQGVLAESVAAFVSRLVNPRCVDERGVPVASQPNSGSAACRSGEREFPPVTDMHIGVITSSLGALGGTACATIEPNQHMDDKAQLVPSMREGVASYENSNFLSFDLSGEAGVTDREELSGQLSAMIEAVGESGCGYEAPLEAMYRFLVDPSPPLSVEIVDQMSTPQGVNQTLLSQRAAFLRPDSSVAIVILSDENDCSIQDSGVSWLVSSTSRLPRSTSACETDANDPCCRSCAVNEVEPPPGCTTIEDDCGAPPAPEAFVTWDSLHDSLNLRCHDQKRRFGFDLLNPISRYETGLSAATLDRDGTLVPNPLFAARDGKGPRSANLVSLSVIVGAPWQDLASSDSLDSADLTFLNASELEAEGRFSLLLPAKEYGKPSDPLMIETTDEREGENPLTNEPLVAANSNDPRANSANGHEHHIPYLDDLQYACIFPLPTPRECANGDASCDCSADKGGSLDYLIAENSPLCQPPGGGPVGATQYFGKGYPSSRQLQLARQLGPRAAYGSICPKQTNDTTLDSYGYVPALTALIDRVAVTLK